LKYREKQAECVNVKYLNEPKGMFYLRNDQYGTYKKKEFIILLKLK